MSLAQNPTAYKIFDVLVEMSRDLEKNEPDKLHTVRLHGQPPVSKAEDARSEPFHLRVLLRRVYVGGGVWRSWF